MINDCKFRIDCKHEKLFVNNLTEFGWEKIREGYYAKNFGDKTKAEIHQKVLPFSGQAYFTVYVTNPETLNKHVMYDIFGEMEKIETKKKD